MVLLSRLCHFCFLSPVLEGFTWRSGLDRYGYGPGHGYRHGWALVKGIGTGKGFGLGVSGVMIWVLYYFFGQPFSVLCLLGEVGLEVNSFVGIHDISPPHFGGSVW